MMARGVRNVREEEIEKARKDKRKEGGRKREIKRGGRKKKEEGRKKYKLPFTDIVTGCKGRRRECGQ